MFQQKVTGVVSNAPGLCRIRAILNKTLYEAYFTGQKQRRCARIPFGSDRHIFVTIETWVNTLSTRKPPKLLGQIRIILGYCFLVRLQAQDPTAILTDVLNSNVPQNNRTRLVIDPSETLVVFGSRMLPAVPHLSTRFYAIFVLLMGQFVWPLACVTYFLARKISCSSQLVILRDGKCFSRANSLQTTYWQSLSDKWW